MLPLIKHPARWHYAPGKHTEVATNFVNGKSVFVVDVDDYDLYRSVLYALGAKSVANKMMAHVNLILHGRPEVPSKARAKYPAGEFVPAESAIALLHQEIKSFGDFVRALQRHGFTVRNPSDEADAYFDFFEMPLIEKSLHKTLLHYLGHSEFMRKSAKKQHFPIDKREDAYIDFPMPNSDVTWYYAWLTDAWSRVYAMRGDGDYPLEIKGSQLLRVAPIFWTESTGMYFHEYPHIDSIEGFFIVAGIDARTGVVNGVAISRVWT